MQKLKPRSLAVILPPCVPQSNPSLPRAAGVRDLLKFLGRHLHLKSGLAAVGDGRQAERVVIPLSAILLSFLSGVWMGLGSIRALEDRLRHSPGFGAITKLAGWAGTISDDTLREALTRADLSSLRRLLHLQGQREILRWAAGRYLECELAQRLRAFGASSLAARAVVAIDGHELFCTEKTQCADCHVRYKKVKQSDGTVALVLERYHKLVVAQWIGVHPAMVLDFEPIRPDEGELTAAYRLVERLGKVYGRAVGTLVADALYDCEPFRQAARRAGFNTVVRHKTPVRQPGGNCRKALDRRDPQREKPDGRYAERGGRKYKWWSQTETLGVRRYVEVVCDDGGAVRRGGCVTDLPADTVPAMAVAMLMETRWWIENTGFHELAGQLAFDRAFIHAGRPTAVWVIAALVLVAYNAWQAYLYRHLKVDPGRPTRTWGDFRHDLWESLADLVPICSREALIRGP